MTTLSEMAGKYALVTGGSSGIGVAIANELAAAGANIILVARASDRLEQTAAGLSQNHGVTGENIASNLHSPGAASELIAKVAEVGIDIEMLVNSAGTSSKDLVAEYEPAILRQLVDLNVGALTELTTMVVADMVRRGHGAIINVASTGAYSPAPLLAVYAASKAYVLSFTQALWAETRDSGVRVVAVSPGPTLTPMNSAPARGKRQPEQVAWTALSALEANGPAVIDGGMNKASALLARLLPPRFMAPLAKRMLQPK
ncbi:SDR family NAD(P)-dependent oxidoreductase [Glutamicibacter mishrai]|uniref:SDR family NAD(P)-dependent oxidoreductase n=1 Tax=Glutamicibacter mishrai TaxID=1775880 RepID=A0A6H0SIA6_9MICC|nr:SDR family NAD(P)-dependent oxidoreductase [Glutamicibacter mishrai]QIV86075.1 SDR family NAD(P)-dependent oxidoreductase [Glutamicibacter mishrai]